MEENSKNSVMGRSQCGLLSHTDKALLEKAKIHVPSNLEVLFYSSLHLSHGIIITAHSKSKKTKRNNSGVMYAEGDTCSYGIVEKMFVFKNSSSFSYCLITKLMPCSTLQLCTDDVTHANLQDHVIPCTPPRFVHVHVNINHDTESLICMLPRQP